MAGRQNWEKTVSLCDCIAKVNKLLSEHNTAIDMTDTINMKTGKFEPRMTVPTARIDTKNRKGPMRVFATYCPMCGEKYQEKAT